MTDGIIALWNVYVVFALGVLLWWLVSPTFALVLVLGLTVASLVFWWVLYCFSRVRQ